MTNPKYLYWYQTEKSRISLPLFKTTLLLTNAEIERRKQRGKKNRSIKSKNHRQTNKPHYREREEA